MVSTISHDSQQISLSSRAYCRIQDSVGEINDAGRRRVEEVLASQLRDASRSLHHESIRR